VAAVAALTAAIIYFWDELEPLRKAIGGPVYVVFMMLKSALDDVRILFQSVSVVASDLVSAMATVMAPITAIATAIFLLPLAWFISNMKVMAKVWRVITGVIRVAVSAVKLAIAWVGNMLNQWMTSTESGGVFAAVFGKIKDGAMWLWNTIKGLWSTVTSFFAESAQWLEK
ncbi:MAG: hypothetical protein GY761_01325, partial [Hyphomicrobiales bacterium]|nr:hypothetical protein [Hyphomicrobiales bacterium]